MIHSKIMISKFVKFGQQYSIDQLKQAADHENFEARNANGFLPIILRIEPLRAKLLVYMIARISWYIMPAMIKIH